MANNGQGSISAEQWQQFMTGMQQQNAALAQQLTAANQTIANTNQALRKAAVDNLEPEEKAKALQAELDAMKQIGAAAQQQTMSNDVWQRRDAESAARLLMMAGMNADEPGLYRGDWDVNWMPRFVASVENRITTRRQQNSNYNPQNNPANRANVGSGTSQGLPEIDADKASGADLIMFALQKGSK